MIQNGQFSIYVYERDVAKQIATNGNPYSMSQLQWYE